MLHAKKIKTSGFIGNVALTQQCGRIANLSSCSRTLLRLVSLDIGLNFLTYLVNCFALNVQFCGTDGDNKTGHSGKF